MSMLPVKAAIRSIKLKWSLFWLRKAVTVVERSGYTVVQMETIAGTNYLVDQRSGQRWRVGAMRKKKGA